MKFTRIAAKKIPPRTPPSSSSLKMLRKAITKTAARSAASQPRSGAGCPWQATRARPRRRRRPTSSRIRGRRTRPARAGLVLLPARGARGPRRSGKQGAARDEDHEPDEHGWTRLGLRPAQPRPERADEDDEQKRRHALEIDGYEMTAPVLGDRAHDPGRGIVGVRCLGREERSDDGDEEPLASRTASAPSRPRT